MRALITGKGRFDKHVVQAGGPGHWVAPERGLVAKTDKWNSEIQVRRRYLSFRGVKPGFAEGYARQATNSLSMEQGLRLQGTLRCAQSGKKALAKSFSA